MSGNIIRFINELHNASEIKRSELWNSVKNRIISGKFTRDDVRKAYLILDYTGNEVGNTFPDGAREVAVKIINSIKEKKNDIWMLSSMVLLLKTASIFLKEPAVMLETYSSLFNLLNEGSETENIAVQIQIVAGSALIEMYASWLVFSSIFLTDEALIFLKNEAKILRVNRKLIDFASQEEKSLEKIDLRSNKNDKERNGSFAFLYTLDFYPFLDGKKVPKTEKFFEFLDEKAKSEKGKDSVSYYGLLKNRVEENKYPGIDKLNVEDFEIALSETEGTNFEERLTEYKHNFAKLHSAEERNYKSDF